MRGRKGEMCSDRRKGEMNRDRRKIETNGDRSEGKEIQIEGGAREKHEKEESIKRVE